MSNRFDAILILGGGVLPDGNLSPWVQARFDKAIQSAEAGTVFIPLSAGTVHKPPVLDHEGYPLFESVVGARYLLKKGISADRIFIEQSSYDTIGNAYFARVINTEFSKMRNLAIVTSEFHMQKTRAIFDWVFSLTPVRTPLYQLTYFPTEHHGLSEQIVAARREREEASLNKLIPVIQKIKDLSIFHKWLFTEHAAYMTTPDRKKEPLSLNELETY